MIDIKVNLIITLQGRVMFSEKECLKTTHKMVDKRLPNGKVIKKRIYCLSDDDTKLNNHFQVLKNDEKKLERITFKTRKTKEVKQVIKLSKEAYNFMTSSFCPENFKSKNWDMMSKKQRLETHLKEIAEALGGTVSSYQIFED